MRKLLLYLTSHFITVIAIAGVYIEGPLITKVCYNTEVTIIGTAAPYNGVFEPQNEKWVIISGDNVEYVTATNNRITLTVESSFKICYSVEYTLDPLINGVIREYSDYIHIELIGEPLTIDYSTTAFCEGSSLLISTTISDLGNGNYIWCKNGIEISGADSSSLEITELGIYNVSAITEPITCPDVYITSKDVEFSYITNKISGTINPELYTILLESKPNYTDHQWFQASSASNKLNPIDGATMYAYNAKINSNNIFYAVKATSNEGCVCLSERVEVNDSIYSLPMLNEVEDTFICNDYFTLSLTKEVFAFYVWYRDDIPIQYGYNPTLAADRTGAYKVIVYMQLDPNTLFESNTINLTFADPPFILSQANICPESKLTLSVSNPSNFDTFQWYSSDYDWANNAIAIPGETDSIMEIEASAKGKYYFVQTTQAPNGCEQFSIGRHIVSLYAGLRYIYKTPYDGLICLNNSVTLRTYPNFTNYQWYHNGNIITGAVESEYKTNEIGSYFVMQSSKICEEPFSSINTEIVDYRFTPSFSVTPEDNQLVDNPSYRIFCSGDTINLNLKRAHDFSNIQWLGKISDPSLSSDNWDELNNENDSILTFINGQNSKRHFKVMADSIMYNNQACRGISGYTTIDERTFDSPKIKPFENAELCDEGDSILLSLEFPNSWQDIEWFNNGVFVHKSNFDSIYAKEIGIWTVTAYPHLCPLVPIASEIGTTVILMPEAEICENDTMIFATPLNKKYNYQWYFNYTPVVIDLLNIPWAINKNDIEAGTYILEVSNSNGCLKTSPPYIAVGVTEPENTINIYPNPVKNKLYISFNSISYATSIELYNSINQIVRVFKVIDNPIIIHMNEMQSGIYFVKINYHNGYSIIYKIIKI